MERGQPPFSSCRRVHTDYANTDKKEYVDARVLYIYAIPAAAVFAVVAVGGFLIWWPLALLAVPLSALTVWAMWKRAGETLLSKLGARGLGQNEGQRVENMVENLCLATGIDRPKVMAIDTEACNLVAIGGTEPTLVTTTGLLETLDLMEMEGVVAHALSKLSTSGGKYGAFAAAAKPFITNAQLNKVREWGSGAAGVASFDISGVGLTRYPPGLRSALERVAGKSTDVPGGEALGDAWFIPPSTDRAQLGKRIEMLWELS